MFESYFGIGDVSSQPIMTEEEYSRMLNTAMSLEDYQGVRPVERTIVFFPILVLKLGEFI